MPRLIEIVLSVFILTCLSLLLCLIAFGIKCSSDGPILYWSKRAGRNDTVFWMPKFRSMYVGTPSVPTEILGNPSQHITTFGRFLRKTSLDELPQFFCVIGGSMSLVGPRPVLLEETKLIKARKKNGVAKLRPGITGWAQINGRDNIDAAQKIKFDLQYYEQRSLRFDVVILMKTLCYVATSSGIKH